MTVLWYSHKVIIIDYLKTRKNITVACYVSSLDKMKVEIAGQNLHLYFWSVFEPTLAGRLGSDTLEFEPDKLKQNAKNYLFSEKNTKLLHKIVFILRIQS